MSAFASNTQNRQILAIVNNRSLAEQEKKQQLEQILNNQTNQQAETLSQMQTRLQNQYLELAHIQRIEAEKQKENTRQQENTKKLNEDKLRLQMLWNALIIALILKRMRIRNKKIARKKALRIALAAAYLKKRKAKIAALKNGKIKRSEKSGSSYTEKQAKTTLPIFITEKKPSLETNTRMFISDSAYSTGEDVFSLSNSMLSVLQKIIPEEALEKISQAAEDFKDKLTQTLMDLDTRDFDKEPNPKEAFKDFVEQHIINPLDELYQTTKEAIGEKQTSALAVVEDCHRKMEASILSWFQGQPSIDPELRAEQAAEQAENWAASLNNAPTQQAEPKINLRDKIEQVAQEYEQTNVDKSRPLVFNRQQMGEKKQAADSDNPDQERTKKPPHPHP